MALESKKKKIKILLVLLFIILFVLYSYITYRANYLQILEIGEEYVPVFEQNNKYKTQIFCFSFIVLFLAFFINNLFIKKGLKVFFDDEKKEMPKLANKSIAFILATILSTFFTAKILDKYILFINKALFGVNDPIFGLDIGFYFFQKPFIYLVLYYIVAVLILMTIYIVAYYIIVFNIYLNSIDRELLMKSKAVKTIKLNVILIVIGIAGIFFLNTYDIVFSQFATLRDSLSTKIIGAGLSDITIKLWGYRLLTIIMIISAIFILKYIGTPKVKRFLTSVCIVPVYLVSMYIIMISFNVLFVNSNALDKEKTYIGYNIDYTKQAYNLNIEETEFENSESITKKDLIDNEDIINNIRLVDEDTTLRTLNSLQTNSGYYSYRTTKLQSYIIDGQDRLVYISPREINASTNSSTYNSKTYKYTHGFGSIISYASTVDQSGNIEYVQKGFDTKDNTINIVEPRIYFGMQTNNTIITNADNKSEFDYPVTATSSAEYQYKGKAGIKLNFIDRLILSIMNKDVNITFSKTTRNSRVILNRNIIKRAEKIIPNLLYDEEPYLVISDEGKQVWVLDAYTISNEFPYAQRLTIEAKGEKKEINYIRNSVKVLIDAYDGTIDFYIMDKTDPIAVAYQNVYSGVFKDGSTIPTSISSHFVYPEYLYNVQAEVLKMYHNVSEDVLYRGDDIWDYASFSSTSKTAINSEIMPYYTMIKENEINKVGLVLPYTVLGKQNITSYLIGTIDTNHNLSLKLYKYASGSNVLGPEQLDKEIEQDETIASQLRSVNVTGTKISKNIIIVPINNSLLYIEPIYQEQLNEKNSIPLLKKVVVASGNKVAIGDNIIESLENLVSQSAVNIKVENTDTLDDLVNAIIDANNNLKDSTKSQDFEMIGKDIMRLQSLIDQLKEKNDASKKDIQTEDNINENTNEIAIENRVN